MNCRNGMRLVLLVPLMLLGACASIVAGPNQDIIVESNPTGAACRMLRGGQVIAVIPHTPARVTLDRNRADLTIICHQAGFEDGRSNMASTTEEMVFANVLLPGGLMGWTIDSATGADRRYDERVMVTLVPVQAVKAEVAPPEVREIVLASQAAWAGQRATSARNNQANTVPVGYREPEQPAMDKAGEKDKAASAAAATSATNILKPPAVASAAATPRTSAGPVAKNTVATTMPATATAPAANPALPAGYKPSASVVDQQGAASAVSEPPMMAGSMTVAMTPTLGSSGSGWKAHLASHRTESAAINEWQELLKGNAALYGQFDPLVEWTDTQRGSFARLVLVGFAERKDADAACAKIRSSTRYCASIQ